MADNIIKFELVTPERVVLKELVRQITIPTRAGEITVLPNHIPLVSVLKAGIIEVITEKGETEIMSVSGGFVEVLKDKVVILADRSERAHEIDLARAEEARQRAEELKKQAEFADDTKFAEISAMIEKELARSRAVMRYRKLKNIKQ